MLYGIYNKKDNKLIGVTADKSAVSKIKYTTKVLKLDSVKTTPDAHEVIYLLNSNSAKRWAIY